MKTEYSDELKVKIRLHKTWGVMADAAASDELQLLYFKSRLYPAPPK